jgi:hypothetical protein
MAYNGKILPNLNDPSPNRTGCLLQLEVEHTNRV